MRKRYYFDKNSKKYYPKDVLNSSDKEIETYLGEKIVSTHMTKFSNKICITTEYIDKASK